MPYKPTIPCPDQFVVHWLYEGPKPPKIRDGLGYVYVLRFGAALFKLGYTALSPKKRLVHYQGRALVPLTIEKQWLLGDKAAWLVEKTANAWLRPFLRAGGPELVGYSAEMFQAPLPIIIQAVHLAMRQWGAPPRSLAAHSPLSPGIDPVAAETTIKGAVASHCGWLEGDGDPVAEREILAAWGLASAPAS